MKYALDTNIFIDGFLKIFSKGFMRAIPISKWNRVIDTEKAGFFFILCPAYNTFFIYKNQVLRGTV